MVLMSTPVAAVHPPAESLAGQPVHDRPGGQAIGTILRAWWEPDRQWHETGEHRLLKAELELDDDSPVARALAASQEPSIRPPWL